MTTYNMTNCVMIRMLINNISLYLRPYGISDFVVSTEKKLKFKEPLHLGRLKNPNQISCQAWVKSSSSSKKRGEGCIELEKVEFHPPAPLTTPSCLICTPKEKINKTTWHQIFMTELSEVKLTLGEVHDLTPNRDKWKWFVVILCHIEDE